MARFWFGSGAVVLLLVGCLPDVSNAAVALQKSLEKPRHLAHQQGCYTDLTKSVIPADQTARPVDGKSCMSLYCSGDNGTIFIYTCGAVAASPPCRVLPGDLTKPHPDCCPKVTCDPPYMP